MAIAAPISKFKRNNLKIYIAICLIAAVWFAYDGYFNDTFIQENTDDQDNPNATLVFNQKSPPFFIGAALLIGIYLFTLKNKKLLADENELIFSNNKRITYDSIQKIDKTYFDTKGYFTITCCNNNGKEYDCKLSNRKYDNLKEILDHLVKKIS